MSTVSNKMSTVTNQLPNPKSGFFQPLKHANSRLSANTALTIPGRIVSLIAVPSAIALGISLYLAYAAFNSSEVAGCGGGGFFDCGHVLHSKWSKLLGVPVSVFAIATHLCVLGGLITLQIRSLSKQSRETVTTIVFVAIIAAAAAALWFIAVQVFVLQHLCRYCLAAHGCGLLMAAIAIWKLPISRHKMLRHAMLGIAGVSAMAVTQVNASEPAKFIIEQYPVSQPNQAVEPVSTAGGQAPDFNSDNPQPIENDNRAPLVPNLDDGSMDSLFEPPVEDEPLSSSALRIRYDALLQTRHGSQLPALFSWPTAMNYALVLSDPQSATRPASEIPATPAAAPDRVVAILGGTIKLNPAQWPLLGDADAKYCFVEMFDYTCKHCRTTSRALESAKETLGGDMAVIVLPVPMNRLCNATVTKDSPDHVEACQLSKLAIATWRVDAEKFQSFHKWLFEGEKAPIYQVALAKARELVGAELLDAELAKPMCDKYISRNVELYKRVGAGPIPKMMFPRTSIVGEFSSAESLTQLIRDYTATP